jgi:hypothetical protein
MRLKVKTTPKNYHFLALVFVVVRFKLSEKLEIHGKLLIELVKISVKIEIVGFLK